MLYTDFIEKLIGLQDLEVKKIEDDDNNLKIHCQLKRKPHRCPNCGCLTDKIHDYREQSIKDIPAFGKNTFIVFNKRRYVCSCGKKFSENVPFLPKYHRMTNRLALFVIEQLRDVCSFTSVAKKVNLSVSTVIRIFDFVSPVKPKLPKVIAIDEFKGNTWGEKYQCIITDPENHKVLDILPNRSYAYLSSYFKHFPERTDVEVFISDMWKPYADISNVYFKKAVKVVDKYHWMRQVVWAFERVRKDIQKQFSKKYRIYFKRSKSLLIKKFAKLNDDEKIQVNVMLSISPTLSTAYFMKERFYHILNTHTRDEAKKLLLDWIDEARNSGIDSYKKCANTMFNWLSGILNSIVTPYTNGFTEGCNNKIKVIKRNAFGYRNFIRFKKRILLCFNN